MTSDFDNMPAELVAALQACQEALQAYEAARYGGGDDTEEDDDALPVEQLNALGAKGHQEAQRTARLLERAYPDALPSVMRTIIRWTNLDIGELLVGAVSDNRELRDTLQDVLDQTEEV